MLPLLLRGKVNPYLIHDEFLTALAAGSVNNTKAEPGPGTRRVTDTFPYMLINSRIFTLNGFGAANWRDPDLYYTPGGLIQAASFHLTPGGAMGTGSMMIISPTDRPADPTVTGLGVYHNPNGTTGRFYVNNANVQISKSEKLWEVPYIIYIIRRPSGGAWYIISSNDANYGDNQLLWFDDTDDLTTATYLGIDTNASQIFFDFIRSIASSKLDTQFKTDYGPSTAYDTFTRGDSATIGSTEKGSFTWSKVGTASISSNQLSVSTNSRCYFNPGSASRIIHVSYIPGVNTNGRIIFRGDATADISHSYLVECDQANNVTLYEDVVGKGAGAQVFVAGTTYKIKIVDFGDRIRVFCNNVLLVDYSTTVHNDQFSIGLGSAAASANPLLFDNLSIYPSTVVPPALLGTLTAVPTAPGAAIFSDAFTDANATELHAHNAAWTVEPTGNAWEINTNKTRMTADGVIGYATVDAGVADQEVSATMHTPNTEPAAGEEEWFSGLIARWTDTNNYIIARWIYSSGKEIECWQKVGGTFDLIGMVKMDTWLAKNTDYAIKLICKGNDLCVYHATKLVMRIKTDLLTGTSCGIGAEAAGGAGNRPTWDDFAVKAAV